MDSAKKRTKEMQPRRQKTVDAIRSAWKLVYKLRSMILAIPVGAGAVGLAVYNMAILPDQVGIDLQASGEYVWMIGKEAAVMGPLALTAVCLLVMFCSRRVVYPWLISLFSLALPILILITNIFPG